MTASDQTGSDLRILLTKVGAARGTVSMTVAAGWANRFSPWPTESTEWSLFVKALGGSVDAALTFKEQVLPDHHIAKATQIKSGLDTMPFGRWNICISAYDGRLYQLRDGVVKRSFWVLNRSFALAIVVAVLKARIAQQEASYA